MTTVAQNSKSAHIAKLKSIKVSGFRSIRQLDLEIGDLTVLIGANGSGKSNLIAFFDMMRHVVSRRLQFYVGSNGGATSVLCYGPKHTPELAIRFTLSDKADVIEYTLGLAPAAEDRIVISYESFSHYEAGPNNEYTNSFGTGSDEPSLPMFAYGIDKSEAQARPLTTGARLLVDMMEGLHNYHFHDTSDFASLRASQELNQNRYLNGDAGNLASILYMLRETRIQHFNRIVSTIRLAVPYFNNFILEPDRLSETQRILLRWQDKRLDYEFGPHQLSDGSLRAIALITLLLQPKDMLPSIILLDEPELGLHPSAVGLIGSLIKAVSADRQVIVATQSPRLLTEFSPEDVVVVEREEDANGTGESIFKRLTSADLGDWLTEYDLGTLYEMNVTGGGPR